MKEAEMHLNHAANLVGNNSNITYRVVSIRAAILADNIFKCISLNENTWIFN